jgi:uncharacterized small protein (DUF1192 family)
MFDEEELPKKSIAQFLPDKVVLDRLSVGELHEYLLWLDAEQQRVHADIIRKKAASSAAAALFKS